MPKIIPPLTLAEIRAAQKALGSPQDRIELRDGGSPGLRVRIASTGSVWSLVAYSPTGERRRFTLGPYPEVSLVQAREAAADIRKKLRAGEDPTAGRMTHSARKSVVQAGSTLEGLMKAYSSHAPKSWDDAEGRIRNVFAKLLKRPLAELTGPRVQRCIDQYPARASAASACRYLRPVLRWAARRGAVPRTLADEIEPPRGAVKRRERILSADELKALLINSTSVGYERAVKFMLLTGARREEVCGARWGEFDVDNAVWNIPAGRHKTNRGLEVPLSRQALAVLGRPGRKESYAFLTPTGGRLVNWDRWQKKFFDKTGMSGWHRHDLRRTVATLAGNLGHPPHVVEALLGHVDIHSQLAGTYNRSRYRSEHLRALQDVADELDRIAQSCPESPAVDTDTLL